MLTIGVQTRGILSPKNIVRAFARIREAGFCRVDFNLDYFLQNYEVYQGENNHFFDAAVEELEQFFEPYSAAMQKYGIKPSQMHAPYPVRVENQEEISRYMQEVVIPKSLAIAEYLGVPWVVIHPFKMQYVHGKEAEYQANLDYFTSLIPLLKQTNTKVCIENLYENYASRIMEGVGADLDMGIRLLDTLNERAGEEIFGFCLDTGHLQLVRKEPYTFICTLGSRLKILHLHENDGIGDLHQMPFTFGTSPQSGLDWKAVVRGLRDIRYDGTLSFETFPCISSFPIEMRTEVLRAIYEIGCYLKACIEQVNA